jgi:hypothetical protein
VINVGQQAAVSAAFKLAGYEGPLFTAQVDSEDERWFLLDSEAFRALRDVQALTQVLTQLLGRKVGVFERDDRWGAPTPFR